MCWVVITSSQTAQPTKNPVITINWQLHVSTSPHAHFTLKFRDQCKMAIYKNLWAKFDKIFKKSNKTPENKTNGRKRQTRNSKKNEPGKLDKLKQHFWTIMFILAGLAVFVGSTVTFGSDECKDSDDCKEEDTEIDECVNSPCSDYANCTNTGNLNFKF